MNLSTLDDAYILSPDLISDYGRDGHVCLRGVLSPDELVAVRPVINAAADKFKRETRPLAERDTYGKAFLQISNLWQKDEAARVFTLARRFARLAAELMEVEGVRLYHDQALFKEPGGGLTPWHQDQSFWPLDTDKTITMWMPLVDVPTEVGSMTFASGTQRTGELRSLNQDNPISDQSQIDFDVLVQERGLKTINYGAMRAGDATFHAGWTLHSAPGNPTELTREVMTIIFFADGVRAKQPEQRFQANDLQIWLPNVQPGEIAASELNPLVYSVR